MANTTKKKAAEETAQKASAKPRARKAATAEEAPAKPRARKAATAEEAPAKPKARKAATAEEAPAKPRARKAATAEEAPAKPKARKAATAEETPAKPKARKAATAEEAPAKPKARKATGTATRARRAPVQGRMASAPGQAPEVAEPSSRDTPPAARFATGNTGPLLPEEDLGELPTSYGVDRLVMVPRDPGWMFLHWELSPQTLDRTAGRRIVLQLRCREAAGDRPLVRQEVEHRGRYYAAVGESCEGVQAVLGVLTASGAVEELLHSDWVQVPPARPRPGTARFLTIPFDEPLRTGRRRQGERLVSLEGRVLTEAEYRRLFGRPGPGSFPH